MDHPCGPRPWTASWTPRSMGHLCGPPLFLKPNFTEGKQPLGKKQVVKWFNWRILSQYFFDTIATSKPRFLVQRIERVTEWKQNSCKILVQRVQITTTLAGMFRYYLFLGHDSTIFRYVCTYFDFALFCSCPYFDFLFWLFFATCFCSSSTCV